ncbi:non-ribosomal peptide synthetase [bacterium]|nr:non-ribosomal peptide synthetase [bacterium]
MKHKRGEKYKVFDQVSESWLKGSVIDRFEEVVAEHGDRPAIDDGSLQLTYAELAKLVERIAAVVHATAGSQRGPVGVLLDQETRFPAALLGVLRARRPYVPLDASFPLKRNRQIAAHAGVIAMISSGNLLSLAQELAPSGVPVIDLDSLDNASTGSLPSRPNPDDLSYIIYTSGTTGKPKGVFFVHTNAVFVAADYADAACITCEDRVALVHSPSVAAAVRCMLPALLTGAALHVMAPRRLGASGLVAAIRNRRITVLNAVPRLFRHLVNALPPGERFESIRWVHLAGDRVVWSDVESFCRCFPGHAKLMVAMASTECATAISQWVVNGDRESIGPLVPVGRDLPHRKITLINEEGNQVPDGQAGEMIVTSQYLSGGYWKDPESTAGSFQCDPDDKTIRSFRTGDLARRRPDGLLEFLGRGDERVKLRGYRVELGEVEATLREIQGVDDAAVLICHRADGEALAIVAYITVCAHQKLTSDSILLELSDRLPQYMLPAAIYILDSMPLLPNYKIDRESLQKLDLAREWAVPQAPSAIASQLAAIFERVLDVSDVSSEDTVFSLGGDSLHASMIAVEIEKAFGFQISPDVVLATSGTIGGLAAWIVSQQEENA